MSSWSTPDQITIPSSRLRNWLLNTGSLTERLVSQCSEFSLILLGEGKTGISQEEFNQVSGSEQPICEHEWMIREVILLGDGKPWVFARSIIPIKLWQTDFTDLNTQPLGQRIFNDTKFSRMPFEITKIPFTNPFFKKLNINQKSDVWGRRSTFKFEELSMMVCEVFLPNSPAYWANDLNIGNQ